MIQGRQHRSLGNLTSNQTTIQPETRKIQNIVNLNQRSLYTAASPSLEELSEGSAFSFKTFLQKTARRASQSFSSSNQSTISRCESVTSNSSKDAKDSKEFLHKDPKLITSHHIFSEMQFIMTLVDISDRLRSVPKSARQSTLIAELTLLNHNLPADVYIPFGGAARHKVARISLSDCVVLNSADRVPFLMMVEVFEKSTKGISPSTAELELSFEKSQKEKDEIFKNFNLKQNSNTELKANNDINKLENQTLKKISLELLPTNLDAIPSPSSSFSGVSERCSINMR